MDQYGSTLGYAVDIVFVIDCTGSMKPVLDEVKEGALGFHDRLAEAMIAKSKQISSLRVRVVAYRDLLHEELNDAIAQTPFLQLPEERGTFDAFIRGLSAFGGGDEPESGLEGLALAMHSDWERGLDRRRHIIVMFTDASAHPLEKAAHVLAQVSPTPLPNSLDTLTDEWESLQSEVMEFAAKRLLIYAPDVQPWNIISATWSNTLHYLSIAGQGLQDYEFAQIIDNIANSV